MSSFLKMELSPNGLFETWIKFVLGENDKIDALKSREIYVPAVIATGYMRSVICIKCDESFSSDELINLKSGEANRVLQLPQREAGRAMYQFYSNEDPNPRHKITGTYDGLMNDSAISFRHDFMDIRADNGDGSGGYSLGRANIGINYDYTGPSIIGMDIIRRLVAHMGLSDFSRKGTFIACRNDCVTLEFAQAVRMHFGIRII